MTRVKWFDDVVTDLHYSGNIQSNYEFKWRTLLLVASDMVELEYPIRIQVLDLNRDVVFVDMYLKYTLFAAEFTYTIYFNKYYFISQIE